MSIIENLIKEIKSVDENELPLKVEGWIMRCRQEGISLYSLERLIQLRFDSESTGTRMKARFVSSLGGENVSNTNSGGETENKVENVADKKDRCLLTKIKNFFKR